MFKKMLVAIFAVFLCLTPLFAQKEQARETVSKLLAEKKIPGLAVSVIQNDKIIWSEGFGFADLEQRVKATPQAKFRIGSISKLLTVAALARLYEKKLIDLDDSVYKYVPTFPKKDQDITIRQLTGHLGGIRHYGPAEYVNNERYKNVSDSLKIFRDSPLQHPPGTKYSYSTYGYTLLSSAIEGAAKKEFLSVLQSEVFDALQLNSTVPDENQKVIENRSEFYSPGAAGSWTNAVYTDNSDRWAAGGFISTSEDLVNFAAAHLKDGFLTSKTRTILFTSQKTSDGKETGVGIGWRIGKDSAGQTIYHHSASSIGGRAFLLVYPDEKIAIAVLTNLTFARFAEKEVLEIVEPFIASIKN